MSKKFPPAHSHGLQIYVLYQWMINFVFTFLESIILTAEWSDVADECGVERNECRIHFQCTPYSNFLSWSVDRMRKKLSESCLLARLPFEVLKRMRCEIKRDAEMIDLWLLLRNLMEVLWMSRNCKAVDQPMLMVSMSKSFWYNSFLCLKNFIWLRF